MGAYGSPDTGNLYSGNDNDLLLQKKKRRLWLRILIALYILILIFADNKFEFIISSFGLLSVSTFIVTFIRMTINLVRKKSVNKDVIILICSIVVYIVCSVFTL